MTQGGVFQLPRGGSLTYWTRAQWGAGELTRGDRHPETAFTGLVIHDTPQLDEAMNIRRPDALGDQGEPFRFMRRLQEVRPDLGSEIPYSFVVMLGHGPGDLVVCEGRGPGRSGAHTAGWPNHQRYGVALVVDTDHYDATDPELLADLVEGVEWIGRTFIKAGNPQPTTGHRDWAHVHNLNRTDCPGPWVPVVEAAQPPYNSGGSTVTAPPTTTPAPTGARVGVADLIEPGDRGVGVELWQRRVNDLLELLKSSARVPVTGVHDATSVAWTEALQRWHNESHNPGPDIAVDGVVGNLETRPALTAALARMGEPWAVSGG